MFNRNLDGEQTSHSQPQRGKVNFIILYNVYCIFNQIKKLCSIASLLSLLLKIMNKD